MGLSSMIKTPAPRRSLEGCAAAWRLPLRGSQLDCEGKARSAAIGRGDCDVAAHEIDQAACDRQTEARAFVAAGRGCIDLAELVEDRVELVGGDADARVLDGESDLHSAFAYRAGDVDENVPASVNLTALPTRLVST